MTKLSWVKVMKNTMYSTNKSPTRGTYERANYETKDQYAVETVAESGSKLIFERESL